MILSVAFIYVNTLSQLIHAKAGKAIASERANCIHTLLLTARKSEREKLLVANCFLIKNIFHVVVAVHFYFVYILMTCHGLVIFLELVMHFSFEL